MKDLEYSLKSLRKQWIEEPERRVEIEQMAAVMKEELALLDNTIPKSLAETEKAKPGICQPVIEYMILQLSEYLNIGKNIKPAQIEETAALLFAEFDHLTLEHFAIVLQRAKLGYWGEIYDRLDGIIIAGWLRKYVEELRREVTLRRENHHLSTKESRTRSNEIYKIRDITSELYKDKL